MKHLPSGMTLFYDGHCPLCAAEIRHLHTLDQHQRIHFVDINAPEFSHYQTLVDPMAASERLHGLLDNGDVITGLDVTHMAWSLVGKGYLTAPLRWPLVRPVADLGYRFFARHRHHIARLLTGKSCTNNCGIKPGKPL